MKSGAPGAHAVDLLGEVRCGMQQPALFAATPQRCGPSLSASQPASLCLPHSACRPACLATAPPAGAACSVPEVSSVFLNMPNLHFIPVAPVTSDFDNDVYVATSEPHGNIEAVVTRSRSAAPHCRL